VCTIDQRCEPGSDAKHDDTQHCDRCHDELTGCPRIVDNINPQLSRVLQLGRLRANGISAAVQIQQNVKVLCRILKDIVGESFDFKKLLQA
jgi:hypothetical protein